MWIWNKIYWIVLIYLKLLNRKLTKTTYDYYSMHRFHIVPFLCVHFSCHKHWYNWGSKTHKWRSIHHFVIVVYSLINRSIHSWNVLNDIWRLHWRKMQVARIFQLLVVVGYWTGKLLRKLREKYGLMVSVQWWRLNNLIFLTNLLDNIKRFFW